MKSPEFDPREYCATLPEPEPPPTLFHDIARARSRQRARRHAVLLSAVLLAGVSAMLLMRPSQSVRDRTVVAATEQRVELELRAVDRELQAAYDRGASDRELARLWAHRSALENRDGGSLPMML